MEVWPEVASMSLTELATEISCARPDRQHSQGLPLIREDQLFRESLKLGGGDSDQSLTGLAIDPRSDLFWLTTSKITVLSRPMVRKPFPMLTGEAESQLRPFRQPLQRRS